MAELFPTISIPVIPYFCNVVVFPVPDIDTYPPVFLLKKTAMVPAASSQTILLEYAESHVYCLLPSKEMNRGTISICRSKPNFLKNFTYCSQIDRKAVSIRKNILDPVETMSQKRLMEDSRSLCKGCFKSHFPRPNTKISKDLSFHSKTKQMACSSLWWC